MKVPAAAGPRRFARSVHAALAVAVVGLWMSGTAAGGATLLLAGVLGWAVLRERRGVVPSERAELLWNLAAIGYLGLYAVDLLLLSRNLLDASLRLLIFLSILRLLAARTDRDRLQLLLISFLAMVAATAATTEVTFALPLGLYLVAALRALACRQLDRAGVPVRDIPGPGPRALAGWSVTVLAAGTVFFFLIPHIGTGYFRSAGSPSRNLSGFSGHIELGTIANIKKNHELALRVRLETPPPAGLILRWRGLAFDRYDGRSWSRSSQGLGWHAGGRQGFRLASPSGERSLAYQVSLEPMGTSALFAAASPVLIESGDISRLARDAEDSLHLNGEPRRRIRYRAVSELQAEELLGDQLWGAGKNYPPRIAAAYLDLPALDPRISELARRMAGSATDPLDVARRIQAQLQRDHTYSLDVNDRGVADPLARFLLDGAPGHCEYFATSMAVLARLQGIPARVVAGFLQGEYSELHGTYLVRQSDAHSWVELYFPGHGWVGFDPTPPAPGSGPGNVLAGFRSLVEKVEIAWDTWIVGLDLNDQASILGTVRDSAVTALAGLTATLGRALRSAGSMRQVGLAVAALGLAAGLLAVARRFGPLLRGRLRPWRRREVRPGETDRLVELYRRLLRALERHGVRRGSHLTPLEFARDAELADGRGREIREITDLFCRARYGGAGLTAEEVGRVEALVARLRS
jgi:hypothetical protein